MWAAALCLLAIHALPAAAAGGRIASERVTGRRATAGRATAGPSGTPGLPGLTEALSQAAPGDTVFLAPGLYEGTHALLPGVSLIGLAGPDSTVLDAAGEEYVLTARDLDRTTVIAGLTLRNGRRSHANSGGGGIYLHSSSPVIIGNVFYGHLGYFGPGVYGNYGSDPVIAYNVFRDSEGYLGGAVAAYVDCAPLVYNNLFFDNVAVSGGAVLCLNSFPVIAGNTIVGNTAGEHGGGAIYLNSSPALIQGNIIVGNGEAGAIYCQDDDAPATIRANIFWENRGGTTAGACADPTGTNDNLRCDPHLQDTGDRVLWRGAAPDGSDPCLKGAGASPWGVAIPSVPAEVLELWEDWKREHSGSH